MFGNLIRDKVPNKIWTEQGKNCSYAIIQNKDTHHELLLEHLITIVNAYIAENSIELLAEIQAIIDALVAENKEAFTEEYTRQMTEFGGYEKMLVFLRSARMLDTNAEPEVTEETSSINV